MSEKIFSLTCTISFVSINGHSLDFNEQSVLMKVETKYVSVSLAHGMHIETGKYHTFKGTCYVYGVLAIARKKNSCYMLDKQKEK